LIWAKHLMMLTFTAFAFVLRMCSFQFILVSKINLKILVFSDLIDFYSSNPYVSGWKLLQYFAAEHDDV
jgi:hypothetical protein